MKTHSDPKKPKRGRTDWKRVDALSNEQITAAARNDRDAKPLSKAKLASMKRLPDVKAIRLKLSMTQEQFAIAFHLSIATVRDWEQGRFQPDRAARTLLKLIETIPNDVKSALGQYPQTS
ncbi:MAG: helix-turn-helix domain-containing protein [Planctomycetes bacterium]|nr:helix-turn-helix domain-containing protein [Planctomycetota bacterium]MBI3845904.1 helix-turn-helix domain-containing protein [Planctomycetota bacterium]